MASSSHREEEKAPPMEEPPMAYSPYASPFYGDSQQEHWEIIGEQMPTTPPSPTGHHPVPMVPTPAPTVPTPAAEEPTPAPTVPTETAAKEEGGAKAESAEPDALIVIIAILFDLYS